MTDHLVDAAAFPVELLTVRSARPLVACRAALAEDGFTVDQWRVLRALGDGGGHLMGELAGALLSPSPTLTRLVDGLADLALVYRRQPERRPPAGAGAPVPPGRAAPRRLDALVDAHQRDLRASPEWAPVREGLRRLLDD